MTRLCLSLLPLQYANHVVLEALFDSVQTEEVCFLSRSFHGFLRALLTSIQSTLPTSCHSALYL